LDRITGLRYAVKIIDRRNLTAEKDQSVYTEARVLSHLNKKTETIDEAREDLGRPSDTGILRLVNLFDDTTHFYIVTNYMVGGDLFTNLTTKRCYSEVEAQLLAVKLLKAVQYMHRKGVVHRDLTADNIFLSESLRKDPHILQNIAIANFRLASLCNSRQEEEEKRKKRTKGHRRAGSRVSFQSSRPKLNGMCGTPSYVAPEVLRGVPYDSQVDMWSIGVILFYAIAGYMPFEDKPKKPLYKRITEGDYGFHDQKWTHVSREAKHFISKLLKVDPKLRYTVDQALHHSWIEEVRIQDDLLDPSKDTATKENAYSDNSTHHSKAHKRMGSLQSLKGVLRKMGTKKNVKGSDTSCQKDTENRDDDETYSFVSGGTSKWHSNASGADLPRTIAI
jgi:serine/threonine protein kinase